MSGPTCACVCVCVCVCYELREFIGDINITNDTTVCERERERERENCDKNYWTLEGRESL